MNRHSIDDLISRSDLSKDELVFLLALQGDRMQRLVEIAARVKEKYVGNNTYLRGLIEFSNICSKNCLYCGIRSDNKEIIRYNLDDQQILKATQFAYDNNFGSIVLQSGEIKSTSFTHRIEKLLRKISRLSGGNLRITLSCGEQTRETYLRWHEAGAHRYLLRIETSNPVLYEKLHPGDGKHVFGDRLACLYHLKDIGYQVGTGVMIGLPFQSIQDLSDDLLFMKDFDIDMVGMGPYLEHQNTPFYKFSHQAPALKERMDLTLKMIALLRIIMQDINIAATTAIQSIDARGREKALRSGANVIMPNVTPQEYREYYALYNGKPCMSENEQACSKCIEKRIAYINGKLAIGEWGDSQHYLKKNKASVNLIKPGLLQPGSDLLSNPQCAQHRQKF